MSQPPNQVAEDWKKWRPLNVQLDEANKRIAELEAERELLLKIITQLRDKLNPEEDEPPNRLLHILQTGWA